MEEREALIIIQWKNTNIESGDRSKRIKITGRVTSNKIFFVCWKREAQSFEKETVRVDRLQWLKVVLHLQFVWLCFVVVDGAKSNKRKKKHLQSIQKAILRHTFNIKNDRKRASARKAKHDEEKKERKKNSKEKYNH